MRRNLIKVNGKTLAELSFEEKTKISHRKIATEKMFTLLSETFKE